MAPDRGGSARVNWIKALRYVIGSPSLTPSLLGKTLISLHEHGVYLVASFTSLLEAYQQLGSTGNLRFIPYCTVLARVQQVSTLAGNGRREIEGDGESSNYGGWHSLGAIAYISS